LIKRTLFYNNDSLLYKMDTKEYDGIKNQIESLQRIRREALERAEKYQEKMEELMRELKKREDENER